MGQQLKRLKKEKALDSKLYKEIADWCLQVKYAATEDLEALAHKLLSEGCHGYHQKSNKGLVETFEEGLNWINNPPALMGLYESSYGRRSRLKDSEFHKKLIEFQTRGNLIRDKMVERILGLEAEDDRREETGKTYERRLSSYDFDEA